MRLLCWAEQFHPYLGGIEVLTAAALPRLQVLGFTCSVITSTGPLDLPAEGRFGSIPVYRFPFRQTLESKDPNAINLLARRIGKLEAELRPDLVHVFLSDPSCLFHLMARRFHASRLVVGVHNSRSGGPAAASSLLRRALTEADWVVGNSAFTLACLHGVAPSCAPRSSVIYSGVAVPTIVPSELSLTPLRIVCVGRLVEQKGFDLALMALARLLPNHPGAQVKLVGDGPARHSLEDLAVELGIREAVQLTGWVDPEEVYHHLDTASVVMIPSRGVETLSQVAIQASLMARPIVATRVGGLPEVVLHEQTGLVVGEGDDAALAEAVARLASSPGLAVELASSARSRATSRFTLEVYQEAAVHLYQRIGGR
jgi:glycogen(starch) synthase